MNTSDRNDLKRCVRTDDPDAWVNNAINIDFDKLQPGEVVDLEDEENNDKKGKSERDG